MPIFVSFARYIFRMFIPKAEIIIFYRVKLLHKHDKLTQCCRAFILALARLSCCIYDIDAYIFCKRHFALTHCALNLL